MKRHTIPLAVALLAIAFTSSAKLAATTVAVNPSPNSTENAGNILSVGFRATGIPAGETCEVWLRDARFPYTAQELVAIDVPVQNGANLAEFQIPFSFQPGSYQIKVVITITDANNQLVRQVASTGSQIIRVRSAIIWPYGGATLFQGRGQWVTWSTESINNAEFFRISLVNENISWYRELLADRVDPTSGRLWFIVPNVTGSGFRIVIEGYVVIPEEDGWLYEDEVEYTYSERLNIQ